MCAISYAIDLHKKYSLSLPVFGKVRLELFSLMRNGKAMRAKRNLKRGYEKQYYLFTLTEWLVDWFILSSSETGLYISTLRKN